MRRTAVLFAATGILVTPVAGAAGGQLDATFDRDGRVVTDFGGDELGEDVAVQADGKLVVVGWSESAGAAFVLARYRPNGSLDPTFGSGGKVRTPIGSASAVAIQRDGRIVVVGRGTTDAGGKSGFAVARYACDGALDRTFAGDGIVMTDFGPSSFATGVAIQRDGKIVVVGGTSGGPPPGSGDFAVARYLPSGALDRTFDGDGRTTTGFSSARDAAQDVALQRNGKILAAGYAGWRSFPAFSPSPDFAVARYNADGSLDAAFDGDGKATTTIEGQRASFGHDIAIQTDGRVVLAGGSIVRYRSDGGLDSTFGALGKLVVPGSRVEALAVQPDGKLLAVGASETAPRDIVVTRLRTNGRVDSRYAADGRVVTDFARSDDTAAAARLQRDGKLVVVGSTAVAGRRWDFALARYLGDPQQCVVPNVLRTTLGVARSRIAAASCSIGRITRASSSRVRQGRVISQRPRAGTRLRVRGKVHLVVSRG